MEPHVNDKIGNEQNPNSKDEKYWSPYSIEPPGGDKKNFTINCEDGEFKRDRSDRDD
jgi:hypothetical protein